MTVALLSAGGIYFLLAMVYAVDDADTEEKLLISDEGLCTVLIVANIGVSFAS